MFILLFKCGNKSIELNKVKFLVISDIINQVMFYSFSEYHNTTGPVTFENPVYEPKLKRALRRTIKNFGYDFVDSNAQRQTGEK